MITFKAIIITITLFQLTLSLENVILIIADDLGIDFIKDYGMREDTVSLPNIEKMIQNGILFENAYSYPSCSPTRASILSGRYGFRTGTRCVTYSIDPEDVNGINIDEFTIPHAIKELNIKNAAFGKWHIGTSENGMYDNPNIMGFEHYAGIFGGILSSYYLYNKTIDGNNYLRNKYLTKDTRDDAIKWLSENQHDQFFLWLAFDAPHHPYHKPPNSLHMYPNLPKIYLNDYNLNVLPWYFAMIQSLDTVIGQIIDSLDENVKNRTNIIFLSDNGEYEEVTINGYFEYDKVKATLYDGGVHIPFFVYGPRVKYPGTKTSALISTVDIFDTVLEMLGCDNKRKEGYISDSISFLPIIEGKSDISNRKYRFCEQDTGFCLINERSQLNLGFTMANSKYKFWLYKNGTEKLYDIENDPHEKLDLIENVDSDLWQDIYFELKDELFKLLSTEDGFEWGNHIFVQ